MKNVLLLLKLARMLKSGHRQKIDKDKIASLLSMSPEAFEAFEQAYATQALNADAVSDNFFEMNSRQAAAEHEKIATPDDPYLNELEARIVNELICQSLVWKFDGKTARLINHLQDSTSPLVTNEEINVLPEELRPQLTGELMKVHIGTPSHLTLLELYWHALNEKNPKKRKLFYDHFRQGLDILDLDEVTRQIISMNKNSMGYWLPPVAKASLEAEGLKVPKTTILKVPTTLLQLTRLGYQEELNRTTLDIVDEFCRQVFELDTSKEYFIKTGTYSSKFDFRNAYVHDPKEVSEIGEYLLFIHHQALQMASPLTNKQIYGASTTDEWVVREYIKDKEENPCIYKGLPLHTEYRVFVDFDSKEIIGMSPYWEPNMMKQRFSRGADANSPHDTHDYVIYTMHEPVLMKRYHQNENRVRAYVQAIITNVDDLTGQWSMDIMQNGEDFWLIDMGVAENSALYYCVPKALRKRQEENWLPILK